MTFGGFYCSMLCVVFALFGCTAKPDHD